MDVATTAGFIILLHRVFSWNYKKRTIKYVAQRIQGERKEGKGRRGKERGEKEEGKRKRRKGGGERKEGKRRRGKGRGEREEAKWRRGKGGGRVEGGEREEGEGRRGKGGHFRVHSIMSNEFSQKCLTKSTSKVTKRGTSVFGRSRAIAL